MKRFTKSMPILFLVASTLLLTISATLAQSERVGYDLSWWTVDGGGRTSDNNSNGYTLGSTIGQPDARVWENAGYSLTGGFWGGSTAAGYRIYLPLVLRSRE